MPENWPDLFTVEQSKLYSAVLATKYANYIPVLMAYMSIIIKCHKRFDGLGWYNYDRAFRRQAATLKHLNWSKTGSTLFSLAFTGKAKKSSLLLHKPQHWADEIPKFPMVLEHPASDFHLIHHTTKAGLKQLHC